MSSAKRTKMNAAQSRKTIGIILRYLKKYKVLFALTLVINLLQVGATLCIPVLVGRAIDMAVGKGNVDFDTVDCYENIDLVNAYGVTNAPTLVVPTADGTKIFRGEGEIRKFYDENLR